MTSVPHLFSNVPANTNPIDADQVNENFQALIDAIDALAVAGVAPGSIVNAMIANTAAIAQSKLALLVDAAPGTASLRTLGPGAQQAMGGNDSRASNSRAVTTTAWAAPTAQNAASLNPAALSGHHAFQWRRVTGLFGDYVQLRGSIQLSASQHANGSLRECCSGLPLPSGSRLVKFDQNGFFFPESIGRFIVDGARAGGYLEFNRCRNVSTAPASDFDTTTDIFSFDGLGYPL